MYKNALLYSVDGREYHGVIMYDEKLTSKAPCILVTHAWRGQDDFARSKAESLAKLGYVAVALDVYGEAKEVKTADEAAQLMLPLFYDRRLLQKRMIAGFEAACAHPLVDSTRIGCIGFCFGGLATIELLRSGVDLRAAVSFHAIFGTEMNGKKAVTAPIASGISGSLLMLHGEDDPLVTNQEMLAMQDDLTKAGVDWQMHIYSHTMHAFTVPGAHDTAMGLMYNPKSDKRSWQAMQQFLAELLSKTRV